MTVPDPLPALTDHQVNQVLVALQLACGRNHGTARKGRQQWFCFLFQNLKVSAEIRGLPVPPAAQRVANLGPFSL